MNVPFCSWRDRYLCHSCFVKVNDFSVLQPLFKHNFEIRLLSFAVLSFRIPMKLRCKPSRSGHGSSWHAQQGRCSCLRNLKVKKEGAEQAGVGHPLHEASGCGFVMHICLFARIYVCIYLYIHAQKHIPQCQNIVLSTGSQPLVKLLEQPIVCF